MGMEGQQHPPVDMETRKPKTTKETIIENAVVAC